MRDRAGMSLGHAGMRQRVVLLGGSIHGTTIRAWIPLLKEEHGEPSARAVG